MTSNLKNKKEKEEAQQVVWEARFKRRNAEVERRKHEDSLKFFKVRIVCNFFFLLHINLEVNRFCLTVSLSCLSATPLPLY